MGRTSFGARIQSLDVRALPGLRLGAGACSAFVDVRHVVSSAASCLSGLRSLHLRLGYDTAWWPSHAHASLLCAPLRALPGLTELNLQWCSPSEAATQLEMQVGVRKGSSCAAATCREAVCALLRVGSVGRVPRSTCHLQNSCLHESRWEHSSPSSLQRLAMPTQGCTAPRQPSSAQLQRCLMCRRTSPRCHPWSGHSWALFATTTAWTFRHSVA